MELHGDAHAYYKETIGDQEIFFKEYKKNRVSKSILELYHILHRTMSKHTKEAYFGDMTLDGEKINTTHIEILDLDPNKIYDATEITSKEEITVTNPKYIPGKTLIEYEHQMGKHMMYGICNAITRHIELISKVNFIDMYGVTPNNIKVYINNNTAKFIVTDISCNIRNLFHTGKNITTLDNIKKDML